MAEPKRDGAWWRQRVREVGARAVVREEMERLGFWPPNFATGDAEVRALEQLAPLYEELRTLRRELRTLNEELAALADVDALLGRVRQARIERVRAEREQRNERRRSERERRSAAERAWRERHLPFLGRGVSAGLHYGESDRAALAGLGMPYLETAADLAAALEMTGPELAWLTYHRGAATVDHYHRFTIPKRGGGRRAIASPKSRLRRAQRWVLEQILMKTVPHPAAVAFRPGISIRDNAALHAGRSVVVRVDLKDFFPSITFRRVRGLFRRFGYNEGIATLLALLTTEAPRVEVTLDEKTHFVAVGERRLPQGACTSPALTNALCRRLDARLSGVAASLGFAYTRYADDLVMSHPDPDAPVGQLLGRMRGILRGESFTPNEEKTRVMRSHHRQAVTGLVVNQTGRTACAESVSCGAGSGGPDSTSGPDSAAGVETVPRISRRDARRFRAFLHQCERDGLEATSRRLGKDALAYARGYLAFVGMVNAVQARRLLSRHAWMKDPG